MDILKRMRTCGPIRYTRLTYLLFHTNLHYDTNPIYHRYQKNE